MKKILVPVDFSDTALGAFFFAQHLAQKMEAVIDVVHVYDGSINTNQELTFQLAKGKDDVLLERLERFIHMPPAEGATSLAQQVNKLTYLAYNTSAKLAQLSKGYDWVIMGMTGKHKVEKKWIGSIASYVAQNAHCPVFLIPNGHQYRPIHQIVYAQNWESIDEAILHSVINFSQLVTAKLHFVHVNTSSDQVDLSSAEQAALKDFLATTAPELAYAMQTIKNDSPQVALEDYLKAQSADLLVLINRQQGIINNLLKRSLTKEMTLTARIPLLVYRIRRGEFNKPPISL